MRVEITYAQRGMTSPFGVLHPADASSAKMMVSKQGLNSVVNTLIKHEGVCHGRTAYRKEISRIHHVLRWSHRAGGAERCHQHRWNNDNSPHNTVTWAFRRPELRAMRLIRPIDFTKRLREYWRLEFQLSDEYLWTITVGLPRRTPADPGSRVFSLR